MNDADWGVVMNGSELIAAERRRQIEVEGWSAEHDDGNGGDDIAWAAVCYAAPGPVRRSRMVDCAPSRAVFPDLKPRWVDPWPWDSKWDKREKHDRIRQLTIAGALIAAEIDRLLRRESREENDKT